MSSSENQSKSFTCGNCGGSIQWNVSGQRLECSSCRTPHPEEGESVVVEEHPYSDFQQQESQKVSFPDQIVVTCSTCGAQVAFDKVATASVCPMCRSSQVLESKQLAGVPPDGLIPFAIDKADAQNRFRKWVKSRWFAPNKLKEAYQEGKLDGVYIPFWTFDAEVEGRYRGRGGNKNPDASEKATGDERYTWDIVRGTVHLECDDLQICAGNDSVRSVMDGALPYNTQEKTIPYNSMYLAGFSAERYSFSADTALEEAEKKILAMVHEEAEDDICGRGYDIAEVSESNIDLELSNVRYKHILLPAWISSFSFGGKRYLYLINGETGVVSGKRPYSWVKIAIAVIVGVVVVALIGSML